MNPWILIALALLAKDYGKPAFKVTKAAVVRTSHGLSHTKHATQRLLYRLAPHH